MQIEIPSGKTTLSAAVPEDVPFDLLEPPATPPASALLAATEAALAAPQGGFDLFRSEMEEPRAHALLLLPVGSMHQAIDSALARLPLGGWVEVLPHVPSTIPYLLGEPL